MIAIKQILLNKFHVFFKWLPQWKHVEKSGFC